MIYTKGPWQVKHIIGQHGGYTIRPFRQVERRYLIYDDPYDLPIKDLRANNARLIAKAPDMYAAIKIFIGYAKTLSIRWDDELIPFEKIIEEIESEK